jgi:hypothetical protein
MHLVLDAERLADLARDPAEHPATGEQGHMLQDCSRDLTDWFAGKPEAPRLVREACAGIRARAKEVGK